MWKYEELFSQLKRALKCIEEQDLNRAESLLMEIEKADEDCEKFRELIGEKYLLLAMVRSLEPDKAIVLLQEARKRIQGYSKVVPTGTAMVPDLYNPLFVFLKEPGKADEIGEKLEMMLDLYDDLCRDGYRCDLLYKAQLAFYRGQFREAQSLLLKAEGSAKIHGRGLDQLCAAEYRGRLAIHTRTPLEWTQSFDFVCNMQKSENRVLREAALYTKCQMWMLVGLVSNVPEWIREGSFGVVGDRQSYRLIGDKVSYQAFPHGWKTHMRYLLYSGNFTRLINVADLSDCFYGLSRTPLYASFIWLSKASAWKVLGDESLVKVFVKKAVEILAPDNLWVYAAEFIPVLEEDLIREIESYGRDVTEGYEKIARGYGAKLTTIRQFMTDSVFREPLTEKEQTVARLAALGFQSKKLAEYLSISPNTVKYHLSNIYKKLAIKNRVELKNAMERYMEKEYAFWTEMTQKGKE